MKSIGFRNSPESLRYAVLDIAEKTIAFQNRADEHCIKYPKEIDGSAKKLAWLFDEICRILHKHPDVVCCAIKVNEYSRAEQKATRFTSHADAVTMVACAKSGRDIREFFYSQLPTNNAKVRGYSEGIAGKSDKYWDTKIADAIAVAYAAKRATNA